MAKPSSPPRRKPRFRERNAVAPRPAAPPKPAPTPRVVAPPPTRRRPRSVPLPRITVERALYAVIVLAGFTVRFWDLGSRAMHGDEAVHAWFAWNLYAGNGYQYDPVYHGPLQFPVTALFFFLFGDSNTSGRLMSVLFGTALIALPYFLRRYMGRPAALVSSCLIAISPAFIYVSRLERDDMFTCLFAMTMAIGILGYVDTRKPRFLYLIGASAALSLAAMENTYITLFVFGTYVLIVVATEIALRWTRDKVSVGDELRKLWRRTGAAHQVDDRVWLGTLGVVALAFLVTVFTGSAIPVPLVLVLLLVALVHRQAVFETPAGEEGPYLTAVRSTQRLVWANTATIVVAILVLFYSTFGTNLTGVWDSSHAFFNFSGNACPGNRFPFNPCRKDIIGGLFYWLSQHKEARGGQPWFYYSMLFGLYEQIVVIFGLGGIIWFLRRPTRFTAFLTYWAVWTFGIYSWAGEKFPWLIVHSLLPFTLLAALFIVELVRQARVIRSVILALLAVLIALELHSAFELNFVYGADPLELMVYTQSTPITPKIAQDIQNISYKVTGGNTLHVTIDSLDTWPFAWYLRGMPNVAYPASAQVATKPFSANPVMIIDDTDQGAVNAAINPAKYTIHRYGLRWAFFPEGYKDLTWSSFGRDLLRPASWGMIKDWLLQRRPMGSKLTVFFDLYVKKGLASPY